MSFVKNLVSEIMKKCVSGINKLPGAVATSVVVDLLSTPVKSVIAIGFVGVMGAFTLKYCSAAELAVVVAEGNDKIDSQLMSHLRSEVESKMRKCSGFNIVDWSSELNAGKKERLIEIQRNHLSGFYDEKQQIEIGKLLEAEYVLFVGVPYLRSSRRSLPGSKRTDLDIIQMQMAVSMQMQNTSTGAYSFVEQEEGTQKYFPEGSDSTLDVIQQEELASELIDRFPCPSI